MRVKRELRVLGIDDGPFSKFRHGSVLVVGTVFRAGKLLEGVVSTKCKVDGTDATKNIAAMINMSRFRSQLRAILLHGVAVGGFNVIDIPKLYRLTGIPVIVVVRRYPDFERITKTLRGLGFTGRLRLIESLPRPKKFGDIFVQSVGLDDAIVRQILKLTITHASIPEALRVAHLVAAGVVKGESSGRA